MSDAPALKEIFNRARIQHIAEEAEDVIADFDARAFTRFVTSGIDELSIMQRMRRVAEGLHVAGSGTYKKRLRGLYELAPRLNNGFVAIALSEYVALYGADDFTTSMEALSHFTRFGSGEFAIRHFLKADLARTLAVMRGWTTSDNEHVRRLASEGSRPRLPWSFHLEPLMRDPSPLAPILDAMNADPSDYVRRSVANSLNDIGKDNPDWMLSRIASWERSAPETVWVVKHALRSLIKKGDQRALALIGAGEPARVQLRAFTVSPKRIRLGERITLNVELTSKASREQRLVVDYAIHYVKKSGGSAPKVFKLKTVTLGAKATVVLARTQTIAAFTTRVHYSGAHDVELLVNGKSLGRTSFVLTV